MAVVCKEAKAFVKKLELAPGYDRHSSSVYRARGEVKNYCEGEPGYEKVRSAKVLQCESGK